MPDEAVYRVRIQAASLSDLRAFLDEINPDLGCRAVARQSAAGYSIDSLLPESEIETARASRSASQVTLTVLENLTEAGRERQAEVGESNRFAARGEVPRGLGRKE